ncbi:unnamed protein product [Withania somnifera]
MEKIRTLLLLVLVIFSALVASAGAYEEEEKEQRTQGEKWFLLRHLHNVGGYRRGSFLHNPMHIGFISMEPNSLTSLNILIPVLSSLFTKSFFIGGGVPTSILAGFDQTALSTALNVSRAELNRFLTRQSSGPIVHLSNSHDHSNIWAKFFAQETHQKLAHLKRIVNFGEESSPKEVVSTWSLRKVLFKLLNREEIIQRVNGNAPSTYNLYNRNPDFENNYGWSKKLDESDYSPLRISGNGVYLVNLSSGSMMAPHVNPTAIEYGIVLKGAGKIQIVYPNGTLTMNARFFGFTTSARRNHPQFLVGRNSLMQSLNGLEFAAAFGIGEGRLKRIANAQSEQVILPSSSMDSPLRMNLGY